MALPEPSLPSVASAPFDKPNADIILRSSDLVDFRTYKAILALASPVFEDMFDIPQPSSSAQDIHRESDLPIISVAESSVTLDHLLRRCYPMENPVVSNIADTVEVLEAAQKYQMKGATAQLSKSLLGFSQVATYPTYAIACKYGLEDAARAAAHVYWKRNKRCGLPSREPIVYVPEMDNISAGALYRLLRFCYGATDKKEFEFRPEARTRPAAPVVPLPPLASSHPFDKPSAKSDLLVQSSDGVHFHVVALLLALSSPVFAELIDQLPDTPASPGARILTVAEDSHMLLWILHFCYPMEDPEIPSDELENIVSVGRKYHLVRMTNAAKRMCGDLAITDALRAYLLAMREGWEEVANEAAKHAVYQRQDVYLPEMEDVTAEVYYQLLVYRWNCLKVICALSREHHTLDTLCTTHWSRSALYVTDPRPLVVVSSYGQLESVGFVSDTLQIRFGMLTVVAPFNGHSGIPAPAILGRYGSTIQNAVPQSHTLAEELKIALLEVCA
ncbi:hypothetical protein B0H21DRAFT_484378 [Amylocystis lapponica]|nr:hypothetical protein B0H21DRAFT_484378 [Amylocystis lapponica]